MLKLFYMKNYSKRNMRNYKKKIKSIYFQTFHKKRIKVKKTLYFFLYCYIKENEMKDSFTRTTINCFFLLNCYLFID